MSGGETGHGRTLDYTFLRSGNPWPKRCVNKICSFCFHFLIEIFDINSQYQYCIVVSALDKDFGELSMNVIMQCLGVRLVMGGHVFNYETAVLGLNYETVALEPQSSGYDRSAVAKYSFEKELLFNDKFVMCIF